MDVKQAPWNGKNAHMRLPSDRIEFVPASSLRPNPRNPRTHSEKQIDQLARSVLEFGLTLPLLIDGENTIVKGNAVFAALKQLGQDSIPVLRVDHLSAAQLRAYVIADNRTALNAGWDIEILKEDFLQLLDSELDVTVTGFDFAEVDQILNEVNGQSSADPADEVPPAPKHAVTRLGDIWQIDQDRLICGDATKRETYVALLGDARARLVITDQPYNVKIDGPVSGKGKVKHGEFVMASGEMSSAEYVEFLFSAYQNLAEFSQPGALNYLFTDWRHAEETTAAGKRVYSELKNVCVWAKTNAGLGSLYRSQHEFVYVFKVAGAPHINNVQLGRFRYRTNVWSYAGANSFGKTREEDLAMHPTVKPVAMLADAILDASRPNDIVLDCFVGSGSTLVAAAKTRRVGYGIELDPAYCDVTLARVSKLLKLEPIHEASGRTFDEISAERKEAEQSEDDSEPQH